MRCVSLPVARQLTRGSCSPASTGRTLAMASWKLGTAKVLDRQPMETSDAKWLGLTRIDWQDEEGKKRVWEAANRSTRSKGGIDAVAILALVSHKSWPSPRIPIVLQYRPPVEKVCVELPAGLIDEGESPVDAAKRELIEECGYGNPDDPRSGTAELWQQSGEIVSDPGMSAANMELVVLRVKLPDEEEPRVPDAKPEANEHIERHLVALNDLHATLQDFGKKDGYVVDARLYHIVAGLHLAAQLSGKL